MAMWVLLVIALNTHMAFSVPGFSTEQTCSAEGKHVIASLIQQKSATRWTYWCIKLS
jgi:hypothetical protein